MWGYLVISYWNTDLKLISELFYSILCNPSFLSIFTFLGYFFYMYIEPYFNNIMVFIIVNWFVIFFSINCCYFYKLLEISILL